MIDTPLIRAARALARQQSGADDFDALDAELQEALVEEVKAVLGGAGINWQPIADIPADRKDGRNVLLWTGRAYSGPDLGTWVQGPGDIDDDDDVEGHWEALYEGAHITPVTHYADLTPPE